ncbi:MAG TPA: endolytic transglycosylase MltG [Vicinamibacterales bacterium]|nr:endolytic transglycosylase MltG [Vicinamibacterales bacterium]
MRKLALAFIFFIIFLVGVPVFVGTLAWVRVTDLYRGYQGSEQFVEIPPGAGSAEIGRRLADAGVVHDTWTFKAALWWKGRGRTLKAGEYRFERPTTALDVVDKIVRGDVYGRRVTFREGLTIVEMAALYESHRLGKASDFVAASRDVSLIADLDPQATDLEGFLFPETYTLPRGIPASKLIALMVGRFRAVYTDDLRMRADAAGLTTHQAITLASLVEKETAQPDERPIVAAVYRNRMHLGMAMQADPTIVYALEKAGRYDGNIHKDDLSINSPYNTYKYPGLPPGPIASPGKASIEATLAPADVKYLYFVSRNDGTHVFAETLEAHNRNVQKFQVEYFRHQKKARRN